MNSHKAEKRPNEALFKYLQVNILSSITHKGRQIYMIQMFYLFNKYA